jgi:hypothetical protein
MHCRRLVPRKSQNLKTPEEVMKYHNHVPAEEVEERQIAVVSFTSGSYYETSGVHSRPVV